jgi:hypothetical protein
MKTKIDYNKPLFAPVTISLTFETQDELAVFLRIMGNPLAIATRLFEGTIASKVINKAEDIIDSFISGGDFRTLNDMCSESTFQWKVHSNE